MRIERLILLITIILTGINVPAAGRINYIVTHAVMDGRSGQQVQRIGCETRCTTMFVLPPEEKIADIIEPTGDWIINCDNRRFVYVVPVKRGIHTSLDLITKNAKVYSFILEEVSLRDQAAEVAKKVVIRERISYFGLVEKDKETVPEHRDPWRDRKINDRYRVRDKHFKVEKVEDNGILTRVYLPRSRIRPAVFVRPKGAKKRLEPVRYSDEGGYYIIHRILGNGERIILKTGRYEAEIRRK